MPTAARALCLFVVSVFVLSASCFDEDKAIYKWSPLVFSTGPVLPRTTSHWPQRLSCGVSRAPCGFVNKRSWVSADGGRRCCDGLTCHRVGRYGICLRPSWKANTFHPIY